MKPRKHEIDMKDPVTPRLLEAACAALSLKVDSVLENPRETLDELVMTPEKARAFLSVVCVDPPDLSDMPLDEAESIAQFVVLDFFLHVYMKRSEGRTLGSLPSGVAAAFQMAGGP